MKFHLQNLKFRYQIILVFLLVFLLMNVGSEIAFYSLSAKNVTDNFQESAEDAISQIENTLETRLSIIDERAESILINSTFTSTIEQFLLSPTTAHAVKAQTVVSDFLKDFERGESLISSSFLYTERGAFDNYIHYRNHEFSFQDSPFFSVYKDEAMNSEQWLPPMEDIIFQGSSMVIPCVRRFTTPAYHNWLYFIYQLDKDQLEIMLNGQSPFFDDIIILDEKGRRILGELQISDQDLQSLNAEKNAPASNRIQGELEKDNTTYLVRGGEIRQNGWKIYGLKSESELLDSLSDLRGSILRISCIVLILSIIAILWISRHLTNALSRLEHQMRNVQNGDFSVRFFYPYRDEIGSLSKSFNYMISTIQNLVKKQEQSIQELRIERDHVAEIQKQKRKAELKALQAQINPHFLYNTLNTITWQVADKGLDDVSLLASSLGRFFRLSLSKGAEIITLADEIEHVRCYLNIQSIRYQDKLRYEIHVPAPLLSCQVLKLILQPLVENAIYHGIKEKQEAGTIIIAASTGKLLELPILQLTVWDDGAGIPSSQLSHINAGLRLGYRTDKDGYGIYNVNERIRLCYGSAYGLSYESQEGSFTKAILTIPLHHTEVDEHV